MLMLMYEHVKMAFQILMAVLTATPVGRYTIKTNKKTLYKSVKHAQW